MSFSGFDSRRHLWYVEARKGVSQDIYSLDSLPARLLWVVCVYLPMTIAPVGKSLLSPD